MKYIEEHWETEQGHVFIGSGHDEPNKGVAILINKRWKKSIKRFVPVNERIAYVDFGTKNFRVRAIAAYFPHCGYADKHVQVMYDALTSIHLEAKRANRMTVIGADCNA